jgi:hypothetical protein
MLHCTVRYVVIIFLNECTIHCLGLSITHYWGVELTTQEYIRPYCLQFCRYSDLILADSNSWRWDHQPSVRGTYDSVGIAVSTFNEEKPTQVCLIEKQ